MLKIKIANYYFRLWKKYAHPYLLKFKKQQHESEVRLYVHSWVLYFIILMQFIHKPYDNWQTFLLTFGCHYFVLCCTNDCTATKVNQYYSNENAHAFACSKVSTHLMNVFTLAVICFMIAIMRIRKSEVRINL